MKGRKKVKLAFIEKKEARRICLKNRTRSFLKKVEEISTLCGVQAFGIVYDPERLGKFTVWPTDELQALQAVNRYAAMPVVEQTKNSLNQETYLQGLIKKMEEKEQIQMKRMTELEFAYLMDEVHHGKGLKKMDIHGVNALSLFIKERLRDLRERADKLKINISNGAAIDAILRE
ncbi:Agamous-like MADS-box protein AGL80 [Linum grandiflorum]